MQGILRSLAHYAGYLAAQGIVSDNIEGWRKGKQQKTHRNVEISMGDR